LFRTVIARGFWVVSPYGGRAGARPSQCAAKMAAFPVNAAFQTVQERFPSQEVIQNTGENIISTQKTMLSALYLDIQTRSAVTFCRFSGTLFVSENRQIVQENLPFKSHSRWYSWHLDQLKAILNFLLRWRRLQERFGRGVSARRPALLPWKGGIFETQGGFDLPRRGGFLRLSQGLTSLLGILGFPTRPV